METSLGLTVFATVGFTALAVVAALALLFAMSRKKPGDKP